MLAARRSSQAPMCMGLMCCTVIPLAVINIMMWVNMFESDKNCGPQLWNFGVVLLVMGILNSCLSTAAAPAAGGG
jgi:hypothetical protein